MLTRISGNLFSRRDTCVFAGKRRRRRRQRSPDGALVRRRTFAPLLGRFGEKRCQTTHAQIEQRTINNASIRNTCIYRMKSWWMCPRTRSLLRNPLSRLGTLNIAQVNNGANVRLWTRVSSGDHHRFVSRQTYTSYHLIQNGYYYCI